jgi:DNA-binding response OmpR family regulator
MPMIDEKIPKKIVLLVEDEPTLKGMLTRAFTALDLEVRVALDYHAAIKAIEEKPPHLVCLDLNLPRESGYDVCEAIRNKPVLDWVQILIISDRKSPEDMAYAEEAGANAYLKKPFTLEQLGKYVTVLLNSPNESRPSVRALKRTDPPPRM